MNSNSLRIALVAMFSLLFLVHEVSGQANDGEIPVLGRPDYFVIQIMDRGPTSPLSITEEEEAKIDELLQEMGIGFPRPVGGPAGQQDVMMLRDQKAAEFLRRVKPMISNDAYRNAVHYHNVHASRMAREPGFPSDPSRIYAPLIADQLELSDTQKEMIRQKIKSNSQRRLERQEQLVQIAEKRAIEYRKDILSSLPMDVSGRYFSIVGEPIPWQRVSNGGNVGFFSGPMLFQTTLRGTTTLVMNDTIIRHGEEITRDYDLIHYAMITEDELLAQLRLDEKQLEELKSYGKSLEGCAFISGPDNEVAIEELWKGNRKVADDISKFLIQVQQNRFLQIELQLRLGCYSSFGLLNPFVIEQLDLSESLQATLNEKFETYEQKSSASYSELDEANREDRVELVEELIELLEPNQLKTYRLLVGDVPREIAGR